MGEIFLRLCMIFFFSMIGLVFIGAIFLREKTEDKEVVREYKKTGDYYNPENWMLAGDEWVHIKSGERRG